MDATHLDGLPLFDGLSKKQRHLIAQHADEIDVDAGKELCHEGTLAWEFFVIEDGEAEVRRGVEPIAKLTRGDFFGEMGVLSPDKRRTASVVTTAPMTAIVMASHALRAMAKEMPDLADRLRTAIAQRAQAVTGEGNGASG